MYGAFAIVHEGAAIIRFAFIIPFLALSACGDGSTAGFARSDTHSFGVRGGTFLSGSLEGFALLATARDAAGNGPADPWRVTLKRDGAVVRTFRYDDASAGSFVALWWPDLDPSGDYRVIAESPTHEYDVAVPAFPRLGVDPAPLSIASDFSAIEWTPPQNAAAFRCSIYTGAAVDSVTSTPASEPRCDISAAGAGAHTAVVHAFSVDFDSVSAASAREPALPQSFDVSEASIAFASQGTTAGYALLAAGGALNFGPLSGGLAVWLSVDMAGGAPGTAFTGVLHGPSLPAEGVGFTYPAGVRQHLLQLYDFAPHSGEYAVSLSIPEATLATRFHVGGEPEMLPIPQEVVATAGASGAATVEWAEVPGAAAYRVTIYERMAAAPTASVWTSSSTVHLLPGTLAAGKSYDAYVTATNAPMTMTSAPAALSSVLASENAYSPSSFTAQ